MESGVFCGEKKTGWDGCVGMRGPRHVRRSFFFFFLAGLRLVAGMEMGGADKWYVWKGGWKDERRRLGVSVVGVAWYKGACLVRCGSCSLVELV